jgi:hypothetical protein
MKRFREAVSVGMSGVERQKSRMTTTPGVWGLKTRGSVRGGLVEHAPIELNTSIHASIFSKLLL